MSGLPSTRAGCNWLWASGCDAQQGGAAKPSAFGMCLLVKRGQGNQSWLQLAVGKWNVLASETGTREREPELVATGCGQVDVTHRGGGAVRIWNALASETGTRDEPLRSTHEASTFQCVGRMFFSCPFRFSMLGCEEQDCLLPWGLERTVAKG